MMSLKVLTGIEVQRCVCKCVRWVRVAVRLSKTGPVEDSLKILHQFVSLERGWYKNVVFRWFEFLFNTLLQTLRCKSCAGRWVNAKYDGIWAGRADSAWKSRRNQCTALLKAMDGRETLIGPQEFSGTDPVSLLDTDASENVQANLTLLLLKRWWSW